MFITRLKHRFRFWTREGLVVPDHFGGLGDAEVDILNDALAGYPSWPKTHSLKGYHGERRRLLLHQTCGHPKQVMKS